MNDVVTAASINVVDDLPSGSIGLLRIAEAFDGAGYDRLARYLRACADQIAIDPAPTTVGIFECKWFIQTGDRKNRTEVMLLGDAAAWARLRKRQRYALIELPPGGH